MRQRTLGILGAVLLIAGVLVSVGSDIAARHFAPASTLAPAKGQIHPPDRHHHGGPPGPGRLFP